MTDILTQFAAETAAHGEQATGGIAALGINLQGFLFQLITFVLVLLLLRKYAYGPLVRTLESRRQAVIDSIDNARKTAHELEKANDKTAEIIASAKQEAADIVALAHKEASKLAEETEAKAAKKAEHVIASAEARLSQDIEKSRQALRREMLGLVADATEKVLRTKIDGAADKQLIERALKDTK
ncbi:MAG: F0F1 ATP synthase subunit B [Candidatus Saccharimonadales bacterium]